MPNPAEIEPHPHVEVFRMMTPDELAELAADIAENGLHDTIVLDQDGRLVDGRNRLAACALAGVEPRFETFEGDDAAVSAFVWARGGLRRNVSQGMRAMAAAMLFPEPAKGGRGKANPLIIKEFNAGFLSSARTVLKHAPDLAPMVRSGGLSLADAYRKAAEVKREQELEAKRKLEVTKTEAEIVEEQMVALRGAAKDLAEEVEEGKLTLAAAQAKLKERLATEQAQRFNVYHFVDQIVLADSVCHSGGLDNIVRALSEHAEEYEKHSRHGFAELTAALERYPANLSLLRERILR